MDRITMNNNQIDINLIIEELIGQISALNLENAVLKARIKVYEKDGEVVARIPASNPE